MASPPVISFDCAMFLFRMVAACQCTMELLSRRNDLAGVTRTWSSRPGA